MSSSWGRCDKKRVSWMKELKLRGEEPFGCLEEDCTGHSTYKEEQSFKTSGRPFHFSHHRIILSKLVETTTWQRLCQLLGSLSIRFGCSTPGHRQVCHWHRSSAEKLLLGGHWRSIRDVLLLTTTLCLPHLYRARYPPQQTASRS
ncbi:hypothetical protein BHM03_00051623 [Ensete ventricosum]|nr:hypothetical protein BHM03_00051623 [Ensete ventricosum]